MDALFPPLPPPYEYEPIDPEQGRLFFPPNAADVYAETDARGVVDDEGRKTAIVLAGYFQPSLTAEDIAELEEGAATVIAGATQETIAGEATIVTGNAEFTMVTWFGADYTLQVGGDQRATVMELAEVLIRATS